MESADSMKDVLYEEIFRCEDHHWWFVARRSIIKKILSKFLIDRSGDILEIGCGSGGNLKLLEHYGVVHGIELDEQARQYANNRGICTVLPGSLPADIKFHKMFDLICLFDVIEHIDADLSALHSVWKKLKSQGKLFITVPAYKFLWSAHDDVNHHKRRYVKKQLIDLVTAAQFRVLYSSYFNTILFPMIFAIRKLKTRLDVIERSDLSLPSRSLNWILKSIFSAERFFFPALSFPFGVSILLLAEKSDQNPINSHIR